MFDLRHNLFIIQFNLETFYYYTINGMNFCKPVWDGYQSRWNVKLLIKY